MALPSSRRPPEVEEDLKAETESLKREALKLKVNKFDVFMATMADWYQCKLRPKAREHLKKRDIIRKAQNVALQLRMRYEKLPPTWLKKLHDEHDVEFLWLHPAEKAKRRVIRRLKKAAIGGRISLGEARRMIEDLKSGVLDPASVEPSFTENELDVSNPSSSEGYEDEFSKRIVDLSNEPPPDFWVAAYVQGKHLPRVLKIHTLPSTNQTIIFYEYDSIDCKAIEGTHEVHESNNFLSFTRS